MTKYSNYINYKQIWVRYEARKNGETLYILLNSNGNRIDNHFFFVSVKTTAQQSGYDVCRTFSQYIPFTHRMACQAKAVSIINS